MQKPTATLVAPDFRMFISEDGLAQLGAEEGQAPMDGRLEGSPANHTHHNTCGMD